VTFIATYMAIPVTHVAKFMLSWTYAIIEMFCTVLLYIKSPIWFVRIKKLEKFNAADNIRY
jgi:hypothetical protein